MELLAVGRPTDPHCRFVLIVVLGNEYRFLDVPKHEITVAVVCLEYNVSAAILAIAEAEARIVSYMKASFEFAISAQFHDDDFVDA